MGTWLPGNPAIQARAKFIADLLEDLTLKDRRDYSVCRAILAAGGDKSSAGFEAELSAEIAAKLGRETSGMYVPTRLRAAGLDTKTNSAGAYSVATEVKDMIELLRNKAKVIRSGATVLSGLQGNQQFPRQTAASSGAWVAQNPGSDVTDSDAAFGALILSPKTYQASTSFSRQFLAQSTIDAESFVRNDLATAHALAIDLAALNGSGSSNLPLGLLKTSGIGSVAIGTNGGPPTAGSITDLETAIADANADEAGMAFLTSPKMRGKLKKIGKLDSLYASLPLWESGPNGEGSMNGYSALVSNQTPQTLVKGSSSNCHAIILGYWPSLLIGEWGVIEILSDPYSKKRQGLVEVTSFQLVDIGIRQPASFAAITDATLT
jgi:HK97 family phage major capsid protein